MTAREDKIFDALAITDTSNHNSTVSDNQHNTAKSILVDNGLDQTVTLQLEGDRTSAFSTPVDIGAPFDVTASTRDYHTVDDYFPHLRLAAICATAPTTGSLTVYIQKAL